MATAFLAILKKSSGNVLYHVITAGYEEDTPPRVSNSLVFKSLFN